MGKGRSVCIPTSSLFRLSLTPSPEPRSQVLSTCTRESWERGCLSPSREGRQTLEAPEKKCGDVFTAI